MGPNFYQEKGSTDDNVLRSLNLLISWKRYSRNIQENASPPDPLNKTQATTRLFRLYLASTGPHLLCLPLRRWEGVGTSDMHLSL
jgi:hypothetical protein